jgi:hypothetical protein
MIAVAAKRRIRRKPKSDPKSETNSKSESEVAENAGGDFARFTEFQAGAWLSLVLFASIFLT